MVQKCLTHPLSGRSAGPDPWPAGLCTGSPERVAGLRAGGASPQRAGIAGNGERGQRSQLRFRVAGIVTAVFP